MITFKKLQLDKDMITYITGDLLDYLFIQIIL